MRHAGVLGLGGLVLALCLALGVSRCQLEKLQERHAAAALRADSAVAANDTTRAIALSERARAQLLGDSLRGIEKRVVQVPQRSDALDKALERERIAIAELTARIDALTAHVTSTSRSDSDTGSQATRGATFDVREEPYTVKATVSLPPAPTPGTLDLEVRLDSARLGLRLGCGRVGPDGVRPATASVVGPVWLPIALERVEQAPELCRSPALEKPGVSRTKYLTIGTGIGVGLCFFLCPERK